MKTWIVLITLLFWVFPSVAADNFDATVFNHKMLEVQRFWHRMDVLANMNNQTPEHRVGQMVQLLLAEVETKTAPDAKLYFSFVMSSTDLLYAAGLIAQQRFFIKHPESSMSPLLQSGWRLRLQLYPQVRAMALFYIGLNNLNRARNNSKQPLVSMGPGDLLEALQEEEFPPAQMILMGLLNAWIHWVPVSEDFRENLTNTLVHQLHLGSPSLVTILWTHLLLIQLGERTSLPVAQDLLSQHGVMIPMYFQVEGSYLGAILLGQFLGQIKFLLASELGEELAPVIKPLLSISVPLQGGGAIDCQTLLGNNGPITGL